MEFIGNRTLLRTRPYRTERPNSRPGGALCAETGVHTGRSPKRQIIVCAKPRPTITVWSENGKRQDDGRAQFDASVPGLHPQHYQPGKRCTPRIFRAGADAEYRSPDAWSSPNWLGTPFFIRTPIASGGTVRAYDLRSGAHDLSCVPRPSRANPKRRRRPERYGDRRRSLAKKIVLIGGSSYAGEIKKAVFTTMNYFLPAQAVHADALFSERRTEG